MGARLSRLQNTEVRLKRYLKYDVFLQYKVRDTRQNHWTMKYSSNLQIVCGHWLVVLGLTALSDSMSVYIEPSSKEREKEERKDR